MIAMRQRYTNLYRSSSRVSFFSACLRSRECLALALRRQQIERQVIWNQLFGSIAYLMDTSRFMASRKYRLRIYRLLCYASALLFNSFLLLLAISASQLRGRYLNIVVSRSDYRLKVVNGANTSRHACFRPSNRPPRSPMKSKMLQVWRFHVIKSWLKLISMLPYLKRPRGFSRVGYTFHELGFGGGRS